MKPHYFNQAESDQDDVMLGMAKMQGYVPPTCLLGGIVVMDEVGKGRSPCWGCNDPRERCRGKPKRDDLAGEKPEPRQVTGDGER